MYSQRLINSVEMIRWKGTSMMYKFGSRTKIIYRTKNITHYTLRPPVLLPSNDVGLVWIIAFSSLWVVLHLVAEPRTTHNSTEFLIVINPLLHLIFLSERHCNALQISLNSSISDSSDHLMQRIGICVLFYFRFALTVL